MCIRLLYTRLSHADETYKCKLMVSISLLAFYEVIAVLTLKIKIYQTIQNALRKNKIQYFKKRSILSKYLGQIIICRSCIEEMYIFDNFTFMKQTKTILINIRDSKQKCLD